MSFSFTEKFGMWLRKTPVKVIKKAKTKSDNAGFDISRTQLEAHFMAGGNITKVIDALILAKNENVQANLTTVTTLDLAGNDPVEAVKECIETRTFNFDQYSQDRPDEITGFCKDGSKIYCECEVIYRLTLNHVFGSRLHVLQEMLSAKLSVFINTSENFNKLQMSKSVDEAQLLAISRNYLETVESIKIEYRGGNN